MAKASLTLPNGAVVQIEGTAEEVQQLLDFYSGEAVRTLKQNPPKRKAVSAKIAKQKVSNEGPDYADIVNTVKDCDKSEEIAEQILDRTSQVNRTLLPLYIVHKYMDNAYGLTSGDIAKITTDLGIPVAQPNTSRTLSQTASRYVIGDKVKKKGQPVRYKLSRKGVKYINDVLKGAESGE